jgi:hypothetical protein
MTDTPDRITEEYTPERVTSDLLAALDEYVNGAPYPTPALEAAAANARKLVSAWTRQDLLDFIWQSLDDSMGPDWCPTDGARRVVDDIEQEGKLEAILAAMSPVAA